MPYRQGDDELRGATLKDADELLWPAVEQALDALALTSEDAAAAKLAQRIAQNIDAMTDQVYAMRWLAPELLKVLDALGATPDARARIRKLAKGGDDAANPPVSWLDQQRAARTARGTRRT